MRGCGLINLRRLFQRGTSKPIRPVIVMPSNNTCWLVHYMAGRYGHVGHLYGPTRIENPLPHLPFALDNGAYGAFVNQTPWDRWKFVAHVERYAFMGLRPSWVVVPDVVADKDATLTKYAEWAPILRDGYHLKLALAVQDGMTIEDVRSLSIKPDLVFVGGTTEWKWSTMETWAKSWPRVHVGRVNGREGLDRCAAAGVESCDGTGWFRGHTAQILDLARFLAKQAGRYDAAEEQHIRHIVRHSRLKNAGQRVLPFAEVACGAQEICDEPKWRWEPA